MAQATFAGESASGWQEVVFSTPVTITADTVYVASYLAPDGGYSYDGGYFTNPYVNGLLTAPASSTVGGNAVYRYNTGPVFPTTSSGGNNYWVTPIYEMPPDVSPPAVVSVARYEELLAGHAGLLRDQHGAQREQQGGVEEERTQVRDGKLDW